MSQKQHLFGETRVKIFLGEFGSGKTEIAINYAMKLKSYGTPTAIVDIDLVKPYFRTRDSRKFLQENDIFLSAPEERLAYSDLPVFPQNLISLLYNGEYQVVIDAGGGESALVLAQIHQHLIHNQYDALLVVNACRPFTQTPHEIITVLKKLETISRTKITGLISNTNIGEHTKSTHIINGLNLLQTVSQATAVPIKWVVAQRELVDTLNLPYPVFALQRYIQYPWMDF